MILVSSCLAGENCRYDGNNRLVAEIEELIQQKKAKMVCPELLGGFSVPREPAEIVGGTGEDVLKGNAKVIDKSGNDVTSLYIEGAKKTLTIAKEMKAETVVLKENSPSCGSSMIYNGTFTGERLAGNGVTAALLKKEGFLVMSETDWLNKLNQKTFGDKLEGRHYRKRRTAYAVIYDDKLGCAAVQTGSGHYFLLGGGLEGKETEEACIKREILEEIGYEASVDRWIGRAGQYFASSNTQEAIFNEASFYIAKLHTKIQEPIEEDHQLVWIKPDSVDELLFHEHQRWAIKKGLKSLFKSHEL